MASQHYVSQFLLRPFGTGTKKRRQIYVLDKTDGSVTERLVKHVACAHGFYDLRCEERSLDPAIGHLEDAVAAIIRRIRDTRSVRTLTKPERWWLAFFIAVQMLRTPTFREDTARQSRIMRSILISEGADEDQFTALQEGDKHDDDTTKMIARVARSRVAHFEDKAWLLGQASPSSPLYISDNPVTRHNHFEAPPFRGNLGLACPGIEVNLPLAPDLILMICDGHMMSSLALQDPSIGACFTDNLPFILHPENVRFCNSLQVMNAERWVFASVPDFSPAHEMLEEHPNLRSGPRCLVVHPHGDDYPAEEYEKASSPICISSWPRSRR